MAQRWAPPTRYMLRRITASIIKDLIFGFDKVAFTRAIFNCDNWHFAVFLDYSCLFLSRFEKNGKMPILAAKFAHVNAA